MNRNTDDTRQPELRSASLSAVSARDIPRNESMTAVIKHQVRPAALADYEAWLQRVVPIAERFPGHRGVHIIRPGAGNSFYTITIRFDSLLHAEDWFQSAARQELVLQVAPFLDGDEHVQTVTGLEFWFDGQGSARQARRYKQVIVTLCVIFPLTTVVPALVRRASGVVPVLHNAYLAHLLASAIVVALMAYVIMPRVTRWVAPWLYR